jgi:hypothetical protein
LAELAAMVWEHVQHKDLAGVRRRPLAGAPDRAEVTR